MVGIVVVVGPKVSVFSGVGALGHITITKNENLADARGVVHYRIETTRGLWRLKAASPPCLQDGLASKGVLGQEV